MFYIENKGGGTSLRKGSKRCVPVFATHLRRHHNY